MSQHEAAVEVRRYPVSKSSDPSPDHIQRAEGLVRAYERPGNPALEAVSALGPGHSDGWYTCRYSEFPGVVGCGRNAEQAMASAAFLVSRAIANALADGISAPQAGARPVRDVIKPLRWTLEEFERVKRASEKARQPVSEFIRQAVLKQAEAQ